MGNYKKQFNKTKQFNNVIKKNKIKSIEKNIQILQLEIIDEKYVSQCYYEYKLFMKWETSANHIIKPFDSEKSKRNCAASVVYPKSYDEPFTLEIDYKSAMDNRKEFKAILYHEFTHIYDYYELFLKIGSENYEISFSWYTEAHARMIELMCLLNYSYINEHKKIDLHSTLLYCNNEITLNKYMNIKYNNIFIELENGDIIKAIKRMQYYLGELNFIKNKCDNTSEIIKYYSHDDYLVLYFGKHIIDMRELIYLNRIDKEILYLYDINNKAIQNFVARKCVELEK